MSERDILTTEELSARWGGEVTADTLANWRSMGMGPKYVKLNNKKKGKDGEAHDGKNIRVVYRLKDVMDYEKANTITPKADR